MERAPSPALDRRTALALLVPFAAALVSLWPALGGGFLSDDFWWSTLLDHGAPTASVDWGEVLRDFRGPWLGGEVGAFYRPLVTLSFAVNFELGGGSPLPFHVFNLAQHAVSSVLCGLLCALCCPGRPALAAIGGGVLFALHPAAVEPVAWASCATSTQEVVFRLGALAAYAWFLTTGRARVYVGSLGLAALMLFTKESGLMLPVSIVVVALLHPTRTSPRRMIAHVLPYLGLGAAYLGLRSLLPGLILTTGNPLGTVLREIAETTPSKFAALLAPFWLEGSPLAHPGLWVVVALLGAAAVALWRRRQRSVLLLVGVWMLVQFLPSSPFPVLTTYFGSRMVYGVVVSLALLLAWSFFQPRSRPQVAVLALLALLAGGAAFASVSRVRLAAYERAWTDMARFQTALAEVAPEAAPRSPLAPLNVAPEKDGILRIAPGVLFAVAQQPHLAQNVPLVNLAFVLERTAESADLHLDAAPLRALREFGAGIATWYEPERRFVVQQRETLLPPPPLSRRPASGRWTFASPVDPYALEAVDLELPPGVKGGKLRWIAATGAVLGETTFSAPRVDLSHEFTFWSTRLAGGVLGFELELDPPADLGAVTLQPLPLLPALELARRLDGAPVAFEDLETTLVPPPLPGTHLVLLTPSAGLRISVEDGALRLSRDHRLHLQWLLRQSREPRCYYYFETRGDDPRRSAVDWIVLRKQRS